MALKAVIFDLDGVLVRTDRFHYQGWKRLADEIGVHFDERKNEALRGVDRMGSLRALLPAGHGYSRATLARLAERKNGYYLQSIRRITPADAIAGALGLVARLKRAGLRLAVASASKNALEVLRRMGIEGRFDTVVTGHDFTNGKPAPDIFLTAAGRLGVTPDECVVVEDAASGVAAALAAGMTAVGFGKARALGAAHWVTDSLAGITPANLAALVERTVAADSWRVREDAFPAETGRHLEAVYTVGNGYMGVRGFFEEDGGDMGRLGGIYLAGVFGIGALPGWNGKCREIVNTPNFLSARIAIDGEPVTPDPRRISDYRRALDMRRGVLERSFVWRGRQGVKVRLSFRRFASMADVHLAGQEIAITPLSGDVSVALAAGIDGDVTNLNMVTMEPLPIQPGRQHLDVASCSRGVLEAVTRQTGTRIAEGQRVECVGFGGEGDCGVGVSPATLTSDEDGRRDAYPTKAGRVASSFRFRAKRGRTYTLRKLVHIYTSRDGRGSPAAMVRRALRRGPNWDDALAAHTRAWAEKWRAADIRIGGAPDDERAVRFNIFQLIQSCPAHDDRLSIGARGLTGEMHDGSVFWDTEIFMQPFFTFTDPAASRGLLRWRHRTLDAARAHARDLWFRGAMYAWKSGDDGAEETEMGVGAFYAIHIIADIAHALRQYWRATGDDDFIARRGAEVLIETARFWASRVYRDGRRKCYTLLAVRGPNEYDTIVHNNCYTNVMVIENLRTALAAVDFLRRREPARWRALAARLKLAPDEPAEWRRIACGLLVPYDAKLDLYLEDDMYLHRVPFDMRRGKPTAKRVIDSTLPYEAMALYQITKQSDIVALTCLLPERFTRRQMENAWRFYEPRTAHDTSLSYCHHAVLQARLGRPDAAMDYFRRSAFLDLSNIKLNTISGIHSANFGGTWQGAVMGFGGLSLRADRLALDPHLPRAWKSLGFALCYRGATLEVDIRHGRATVTLTRPGPAPVLVELAGRRKRLARAGERVVAP